MMPTLKIYTKPYKNGLVDKKSSIRFKICFNLAIFNNRKHFINLNILKIFSNLVLVGALPLYSSS
jgi:hypothetical protein